MKHILLVLREPFLDRIPSLKTLVWFLLNHNHRITLITSESNKFILLSFDHENLQIIKVKQRSKRFESPTTLKIVMENFVFCIDKKSRLFDGGGCDWKYYCFENISTLGKKTYFFYVGISSNHNRKSAMFN